MSFYTAQKDMKAQKQAQREREAQRQENIRKDLERNSFKSILAAEAAKDAAAAEAQQNRIKALEAEQRDLIVTLRNESIWLLTEPDPEHTTYPDAPHAFSGDFATGKTGEQQAYEYSTEQFLIFKNDTPAYLAYQENADALDRYLRVNGSNTIVSAKQFKEAFTRLYEAGLMVTGAPVEKTSPAPEPWCWVQDLNWDTAKDGDIVAGVNIETGEPASYTYAQVKRFDTEELRRFISRDLRSKPAPLEPEGMLGMDLNTGEMRIYSEYEQQLMDADTFRKVFRPKTNLRNLIHAV